MRDLRFVLSAFAREVSRRAAKLRSNRSRGDEEGMEALVVVLILAVAAILCLGLYNVGKWMFGKLKIILWGDEGNG